MSCFFLPFPISFCFLDHTNPGGKGGNVMRNPYRRRLLGWYCAFLTLMLYASPIMQVLRDLPEVYYIRSAQDAVDLSSLEPFGDYLSVTAMSTGEELTREVLTGAPVFGSPSTRDQETWQIEFLGIPVRQVELIYEEPRTLIAGGECISISMQTQGVLVVGCTQMMDENARSVYPASLAGIREGDILLTLNGHEIRSAQDLTEQMNNYVGDGPVYIEYLRKDQTLTAELYPVRDPSDGRYRLGLWVRDAMNGIGTLSYVDPVSSEMGALGHGITDADTGILLPLSGGSVHLAESVQILASHAGAPGELRGSASDQDGYLGHLTRNTAYGIFGINQTLEPMGNALSRLVPIAHDVEVHTGDATILCTLDDGVRREYTIRILRLTRRDRPQTKGILLEVTDESLLSKTGGIIQGMSGSPIIQDGKLVGAVTHVLVNDPTRGYGIFIENMLSAAG